MGRTFCDSRRRKKEREREREREREERESCRKFEERERERVYGKKESNVYSRYYHWRRPCRSVCRAHRYRERRQSDFGGQDGLFGWKLDQGDVRDQWHADQGSGEPERARQPHGVREGYSQGRVWVDSRLATGAHYPSGPRSRVRKRPCRRLAYGALRA